MRRVWLPLLLLAVSVKADTPATDFGRYQIIIDRMPFGSLPAAQPAGGAEANQPPKPSFAERLRLSMIVEEDDGSKRIGFIDKGNNKSYIMGLGDEPQDGITLVSADFSKQEAVLKQGDEEVSMKLTSGEVTRRSGPGVPPGAASTIRPPTAGAPAVPALPPSYADRRRMRMMNGNNSAEVPEANTPKYTGEELQKHLQQYKLDVIRQGLPALPIPLTPEEDAQLVNEGVLPPQP